MKLVQLIDDLGPAPQQDIVRVFDEAARSLGLEPFVCSRTTLDGAPFSLASKSILLELSEDDLVIMHISSRPSLYLLDFLSSRGRKWVYYHGSPDPGYIRRHRPFHAREIDRKNQQLSKLFDYVDSIVVPGSREVAQLETLGYAGVPAIFDDSCIDGCQLVVGTGSLQG